MRNRRSIILLLLAILALAAANLYVAREGGETPRAIRTTLLDVAMSEPEVIRLDRGEAETVSLAREDGVWRFAAPLRGKVDDSAVKRVLDSLCSAVVLDTLTVGDMERLGADRTRFGLDSQQRLRLSLAASEKSVAISFGRNLAVGDGVYAAIEGDRQIYVVSSNVLAAVDRSADDFRLREVVACSPSDIVSLDLKRGTGSLMRFVRGDDGWKMTLPREARAGTERLKKLLTAISAVTVKNWEWPRSGTNGNMIVSSSLLAGYGLDPDSALAVLVKNVKGEDVRFSLGDPADKESVYALLPATSEIVTLDSSLKELAIGESAYFTDMRLFPIDRKLVESVSISDGGVSCILKLGDSGSWMMESPIAANADEAETEALIKRLLALGPSDVDTNGVTVAVSTNLPSAIVSRQALFGDGGLEKLRSRRILKVDPSVIKRLVVSDRDGAPSSAVYSRETKKWQLEQSAADAEPAGAESTAVQLDDSALDAIAAAMNPLAAVSVARLKPASARLGEYGLDHPFRSIAVDMVGENSARRTVLIGAETDDGGRYATVGASDAVFVLSPETVTVLTRAIHRQ